MELLPIVRVFKLFFFVREMCDETDPVIVSKTLCSNSPPEDHPIIQRKGLGGKLTTSCSLWAESAHTQCRDAEVIYRAEKKSLYVVCVLA